MTDTLKILAQVFPSAITLTTLYTVPAATSTSVSSIIVCNQSVVGTTFRISVAQNGAADTPSQYIFYELPLDSFDTFVATIGLSLAAGDVIRVYADSATLSFGAYGVEITA